MQRVGGAAAALQLGSPPPAACPTACQPTRAQQHKQSSSIPPSYPPHPTHPPELHETLLRREGQRQHALRAERRQRAHRQQRRQDRSVHKLAAAHAGSRHRLTRQAGRQEAPQAGALSDDIQPASKDSRSCRGVTGLGGNRSRGQQGGDELCCAGTRACLLLRSLLPMLPFPAPCMPPCA